MPTRHRLVTLFIFMLAAGHCSSQSTQSLAVLNIQYHEPADGFSIFDVNNNDVVIIGEDVHNRIDMPRVTLKFLQQLHELNGTRVLAIEGGTSTAWLINRYLETQDSLLLRDIVRHTFFWGVEHHQFLRELAEWNLALGESEKITVVSADIELKQESVVLAMNVLMTERAIPTEMLGLRSFRDIFEGNASHRNQFDALNVYYYYDKGACRKAAGTILEDMKVRPDEYEILFGADFELARVMLQDLINLYKFNYREQIKFAARDEIIFRKLVDLQRKSGITKFLYVVGGKHTGVGASSYRLQHDILSPFKGRIMFINVTGRKPNGKFEGARDVTELSKMYPETFCRNCDVLVRNDGTSKQLTQISDYTLAFRRSDHVRRFQNTFTGK